jgi:hypothetical protein
VQQGGYAWQLIEQMQLPAAAHLLQSSRDKQALDCASSTSAHAPPSSSPPPAPTSNMQLAPSPTAPSTSQQQQEGNSLAKRPRAADVAEAPSPAVRMTRSRLLALQN